MEMGIGEAELRRCISIVGRQPLAQMNLDGGERTVSETFFRTILVADENRANIVLPLPDAEVEKGSAIMEQEGLVANGRKLLAPSMEIRSKPDACFAVSINRRA
ncbi:MAG: hypothetical protein U0744_19200 [Gemmataceae bacterium]